MALGDDLLLDTGEDIQQAQGFQTFAPGSREEKRDLKRRNGGLKLNRKADAPQINATVQSILNGSFTTDQSLAKIQRNPGSADIFRSALQRRQQREQILQGATALPQDQFGQEPQFRGPKGRPLAEEEGGVLSGGLRPDESLRQAGQFSAQEAIKQATKLGRFDIVKQLQATLPKQERQARPIKIDGVDAQGKAVTHLVDPSTRQILSTFRKSPKDLTTKQKEILTNASRKFETSTRSIKSFRPEFASTGFKTIGNLEIELAKRKSDPASLRKLSWWQNFLLGEGLTRKDLFGSQIPEGEMAQWERLTLTPDMSAAQIANRLRQRRAIQFKWLTKQARVSIKGSRANQQQIDAALGPNAKAIRTGKLPSLKAKSGRGKARAPRGTKETGVVDFNSLPSRGR